MPEASALIKGGKVKSVYVGPVYTEITITIPTETIVRRGSTRKSQETEVFFSSCEESCHHKTS